MIALMPIPVGLSGISCAADPDPGQWLDVGDANFYKPPGPVSLYGGIAGQAFYGAAMVIRGMIRIIRYWALWFLALLLSLSVANAQLTIAPEPVAQTNAILQTFPAPAGATMVRRGFYALGDVPELRYVASRSACSLNSGNGDNGAQVKSADNRCWLAVPPSTGMDIRQWGATPAADIVAFMAAAYAANLGVKIIIPAGVWQVQSATTFSAQPPRFEGVGWAEHNTQGASNGVCPTNVTNETWLHEAAGMAGTIPFTVSGFTPAGNSTFSRVAFCQDHPAPSNVTASISGTTLTCTVGCGSLAIGQGIGAGTGGVITSVLGGTVITGGSGTTWTVNNGQTVSSQAMTAWAPTQYQPIFETTNNAGEIGFDDIYLYGVYQFLFTPGTGTNGRQTFHHIRGQVYFYLLNLDSTFDVVHGEDVHIWPLPESR